MNILTAITWLSDRIWGAVIVFTSYGVGYISDMVSFTKKGEIE